MSINSFICKHFDDDRKGYVNIADIIIYPFRILGNLLRFISDFMQAIILFLAVFIIIGMVSALVQGFVTTEYPSGFKDFFVVIINAWILPGMIITISYILYKPAKILLDVKVAKCPLKENKEDD